MDVSEEEVVDDTVTQEGLTLLSYELLPRSEEFEAVCAKLQIPSVAYCVGLR
jgi:hypothetical protein